VVIIAHVVGMRLVINKDANLLVENGGHISLLGKISPYKTGFC